MATAKKTLDEPLEPGGVVTAAASAVVGDKGQEEFVPAAPVELESDPGGVFINTGEVDLILLQPATVLKPDRVVELEYDPGHRDVRRATPEEIDAARQAEAADTGQEQ